MTCSCEMSSCHVTSASKNLGTLTAKLQQGKETIGHASFFLRSRVFKKELSGGMITSRLGLPIPALPSTQEQKSGPTTVTPPPPFTHPPTVPTPSPRVDYRVTILTHKYFPDFSSVLNTRFKKKNCPLLEVGGFPLCPEILTVLHIDPSCRAPGSL